jgi:guanylate kinase
MIVISSPSGGGKSTLCQKLLAEYGDISYSVSCTTRKPRGKEEDGVSYHFLDRADFEQKVKDGLFLEHAEVHGNMYGTLRHTVESALSSGRSVLLDIDVQGASQIRSAVDRGEGLLKSAFVDVFITPPSLDELRSRLMKRGEDSAEVVELRLVNAAAEMRCAGSYRYVIQNDDLESAYMELTEILEKESLS